MRCIRTCAPMHLVVSGQFGDQKGHWNHVQDRVGGWCLIFCVSTRGDVTHRDGACFALLLLPERFPALHTTYRKADILFCAHLPHGMAFFVAHDAARPLCTWSPSAIKVLICEDPGARPPRNTHVTGRPWAFGDPTGYTSAR